MKTDWITKALLVFVGTGLWAVALMHGASRVNAQAPAIPQVIKAQKFLLVDSNGKTIAALGALQDNGMSGNGLAFYDSQGVRRIGIGVLDDGAAGFALSDSQAKRRLVVGLDGTGNLGVMAYDAQGNIIYQKP